MASYKVVVGNIGTVYDGLNASDALDTFNEYVRMSKTGHGRAGNEPVTMFRDYEPVQEYEVPEMTTQQEYDSASFEADLGMVEQKFKELNKILDSEQFRRHVDATWMNMPNTDGLVKQHENLMFKVLQAKCEFETFADRIRDL